MTNIGNLTFQEQDEFNRKPIAINIIKILNTGSSNFTPLVIDGNWGTGKTVFCHKLINFYKSQINNPEGELKEIKDANLIYFDAFKYDYLDTPILSLLTAIITSNEEIESKDLIHEISKNNSIFFLETLPRIITKVGTSWISSKFGVNIGEVINELNKSNGDGNNTTILKEYELVNKGMFDLKENLTRLAETKPIIFFIDELDRCRPNYALEFLEVIKHIFDIPNIKFVLVTKLEQLAATISHRYGDKVDSKEYLGKFIKYSFQLQMENRQLSNAHIYFEKLWEESSILNSVKGFKKLTSNCVYLNTPTNSYCDDPNYIYVHEVINRWINEEKLSLRQIEDIIRSFEIYQIFSPENKKLEKFLSSAYKNMPIIPCVVISIIILYTIKTQEINKIRYSKESLEELLMNESLLKISREYISKFFPYLPEKMINYSPQGVDLLTLVIEIINILNIINK